MSVQAKDRAGAFELTGRRAEWLALACGNGGFFTRAQLEARLATGRQPAQRLVRSLAEREFVQELKVEGQQVWRVVPIRIFEAAGAESHYSPYIPAASSIVRRLLALDYVIEHPGLPWLTTTPAQVGAFGALGIERHRMPTRVYKSRQLLYFPNKMPVALEADRALFVFADPGHTTALALRTWCRRNAELWRALAERGRAVEATVLARTVKELVRARRTLARWTRKGPALRPDRAREEIARIERAIRGGDAAALQGLGGLQAGLERIVELRKLEREGERPNALLDGVGTWRSERLREAWS